MKETSFYQNLANTLQSAKKILCVTHVGPDADGIGSMAALCMAMKQLHIPCTILLEHKLNQRYTTLVPQLDIICLSDEQDSFKQQSQTKETWIKSFDLVVVIDTNSIARTGLETAKLLAAATGNIIFIDHHPFHGLESDQYFIDMQAAATGEMMGHLLEFLPVSFTRPMCFALYTAILIDTNVFRYQTVTSHTHRLIAKLLESGPMATEAYNLFYGTRKLNNVHLLGHILKNCKMNSLENIAWIWISENDFKEYKSDMEETHAYINNLLSLEGIRVACMFREDGNRVKLSLRSRGDIDLSAIAVKLGGGGHSHSAAALLNLATTQEELEKNVINLIEENL